MEMFLLFLVLLSWVVLFSCITIQYYKPRSIESLPLPPGKSGFPIIGETLDFFFKFTNGAIEKFITDRIMQNSSKVFKTSVLGESMAFLCGVEGNKFLFSNENKKVRFWIPNSLDKLVPKSRVGLDNVLESAKLFHDIVHPFLKAEALHRYVPIMDTIMKQCIEIEWEDGKELKVSGAASKYTYTLVCRLLLCIKDLETVESFSKKLGVIVKGLISPGLNLPGTKFHRAVKASEAVRKELVEGVIKQRKNELLDNKSSYLKNEDILSRLLVATYKSGEVITDSDVASHLLGLAFGSTHTVNSVLTFIMMYLAELPHVYNEVLKEQMQIARTKGTNDLLNWEDIRKMRYSRNVMNEVMRLRPPSFGGFREAITDIVYGGYIIPKGWKIPWIADFTHRNPKFFPDPEKFDPSRYEGNGPPPFAFVPFGGGPRMCPGNEFARIVILIFMHNVVTKFQWEKLIPNEKIVYDPTPRPTKGLPIRLHAHKPLIII